MANDNSLVARGGLRPVETPYGGLKLGLYKLTTNATVGVFIGAPMDLDSNGQCVLATTGSDLTFILGPAMGFVDSTTKGGLPESMTSLSQGAYLPANKDAYVMIADDPNQVFVIQCDTSANAAATDIGSTARFTVGSSISGNGNTTTGSSYAELLGSDIAADTGGSLKIVGIYDRINSDGTQNTAGANYVKLRVKIYRHRLSDDGRTDSTI